MSNRKRRFGSKGKPVENVRRANAVFSDAPQVDISALALDMSTEDAWALATTWMPFGGDGQSRDFIEKQFRLDRVRSNVGRIANKIGLGVQEGTELERILLNEYLLGNANLQRRQPNLAGAVSTVRSEGKPDGSSSLEVKGEHGETLVTVPPGECVLVQDVASMYWDDLAEFGRQYAAAKERHQLPEMYRAFRWATVSAVCVIESLINDMGAFYLTKCRATGQVPNESIRAEFEGTARVTLDDKLRTWPRIVAGDQYRWLGDLWDDVTWKQYNSLVELRDQVIHNKQRALVAKNPGDSVMWLIYVFCGRVLARLGDAIGREVTWLKRNREVFEQFREVPPAPVPTS